ncbi:MAG: hypothetical protein M0R80_04970, partial [Proteobacteria bacterium]|nr:hypothetical protein [Pseudomonadota bacterium]
NCADGRPGTARLLATEVTGSCFTDDGTYFPAPGFVSATPIAGGALAAGVWVYRMTAVVDSVESVAGYRVSVETAAGEGSVTLSWNAVPGATYNVYRTSAVATESTGDEDTFLLASGLTGVTTWTDDGSATPDTGVAAWDGIAVLPPGTLSLWTELEEILVEAREGAGAVALTVPSGSDSLGDKTYIFVGGGRPHAGGDGYFDTIEKALVLEDGDLGAWTTEIATFNVERAFFPLLTTKNRDETFWNPETPPLEKGATKGTWPEPIFLFALAGDDLWSGVLNSGIQSIEAALVTSPDGVLDAWHVQAYDLPMGRRTYAHDGLLIDDYLYCLPGVDQEGIAGEPSPLINVTSRFPIDVFATDLDYVIDTTYMSSNAQWTTARSYYDIVRVNGYVYTMGGNDGTGPIASIESIPQ